MADTKTTVFPLSPIDMLMPRMHVPKLLYFASTAEPATIISILRVALELTIESIPIIAGSVALSTQADEQKGFLNVQSPYFTATDIISTKDLRSEYDYEQLRAAHFPVSGVPFDVIAPKAFGKAGDSAPVMVAQANLLRGGLLLFFALHHCVFDEMGIFNVMKVWASYCRRGGELDLITPQWFDRSPLSQGEGKGRLEDHPEYTLSPKEAIVRATEDPSTFYPIAADVDSVVFFISDESLDQLKMAAKNPGPDDRLGIDSIHEITTNDALIALFWCCITSARINDSTQAIAEIFPRFGMAMNGRSQLRPAMSTDYCGNAVLIAKTFTRADDLISVEPGRLARAALLVRKSVKVVNDVYIKDVIQMVRNVDDVGRLAPRRRPAVDHSLGCSTWARQPYYSLDWGQTLGGSCERVRWRRLQTDGLFIIFPRLPPHAGDPRNATQGGVEVQLALKRDHLEKLMEDPLFTKYVQWRCS
ncbi:hypothetical protein P7C71_g1545, partial [Lecanoromycetidae sp. Uapishka_2]